ncbi:MFS general substrate transporter [Aspergillus steynii IBT 23096]|uniref:MFS general substrate transporter n=1 Tax=Aspergillus steynii IBT 23096 TaxID=1392250 RepID=A0A2I2FT88_9EURO|nr:MFS general substrate transporter [Aspergillus steynii IBT 23096]PLB43836.1 MFS general substrate transporter [Aspergillus steynii IBT 23096]
MQAYLQYRAIRASVRNQLDQKDQEGYQRVLARGSSDPFRTQNPDQQQRQPDGTSLLPGIQLIEDTGSRNGEPSHIFLVDWESDHDVLNPRNFSLATKMMGTFIVSALAFVVSASSSIESAVLAQSSAAYHVSEVVASLFTAVFLLGFATGTLVSGPLSEILGRNAVYAISTSLFMLFVMGSGLSPNVGAKLACRFLAGVCGCPPLTCAGGTVADLWDPLEKTLAFPVYAILSFGGAILSPVIASYMGQGTLSWRWVNWIVLIMGGLVLGLVLLLQPETYSPLLLKWKAQHLRRLTGDPRYRSKLELGDTPLPSRIARACGRQFTLAVREPIILLLALYMTVLYIVLFTFFDGYAFIFTDVHGLSQPLTNIVWVAMYVGIMLAALLLPGIYSQYRRTRLAAEEGPGDHELSDASGDSNRRTPPAQKSSSSSPDPEHRLWYAMIGAPAIPISLFWMGWTDYRDISIWSPILGSGLFGFGSICVFISSYMYVIDAYEIYAASALGFMTVTRYFAAGGMTVVGIPFYRNLGVHWTLTILGVISAVMTPVPFVFWKFGRVIRGWSRFAV